MDPLAHRAPRTRLPRILGVLTGPILLLVILIVIVRYSDIWVHQFGEREPAHLLQAATVRRRPCRIRSPS